MNQAPINTTGEEETLSMTSILVTVSLGNKPLQWSKQITSKITEDCHNP